MSEPTRFRSRIVIMTAADWSRFSEALKIAFPDAIYVMHPIKAQTERPRSRPPRLLMSRDFFRIQQAAARWNTSISMIFDPRWQPRWYCVEDQHAAHYWSYWPPHHPSVDFRFVTGFRQIAGRPADIHDTWIDFRCNPAFPEHFLLAGRFYRLLGKFCSNRNLAVVDYPGGRVIETYVDKGAWRWVGHDARRWALSHPSHFLEVHMQNPQGLRPLPADGGAKRRARRPKTEDAQATQDGAVSTFAYRSHFVVMTAADMAQLSERLAGEFPEATYYMEPFRTQWLRETPRILAGRQLYRIWRYAWRWHSSVRMVFDPSWRPVLRHLWTPYGKPGWRLWRPKLPHVHFEGIQDTYRRVEAMQSMSLGLVSVQYDSAVPSQCRIADRFAGALAMVAGNRDLEAVDMKTGAVTDRFIDRPAWAWIGHDARRWALESPDHFLEFSPQKMTGLRPVAQPPGP